MKIKNVEELIKWITSHSGFDFVEREYHYFTIQCPELSLFRVNYKKDDNIWEILMKTLEILDDFDADREFNSMWEDVCPHNNFTPSQFLRMLMLDEESLHELAKELRQLLNS